MALSEAFDDVSNLSDVSLSDEECDIALNKISYNNETDLKTSDFNRNHLDTSTPTRSQPTASTQHYSRKLPNYKHHNISDVSDEESLFSDSEGRFKSKKSVYTDKDRKINGQLEMEYDHFNKEQISSSLLLENDKLTKQLVNLNTKCSTVQTDYQTLQTRFYRLFGENKSNLEIIEQLQSTVSKLEFRLKEERKSNDYLKSEVDSLEELNSEHLQSDFVTRTNDAHERMVTSLKHKYEKEINQLRSDMEQMTLVIHRKEEDIREKDDIIEKYKDKMKKEVRRAKEKYKSELLASMDEKMANLKEGWQNKLREDVEKIIKWMNTSSVGERLDHHVNVEFDSLQGLCDILQKTVISKELQIDKKINAFKETKRQLENALSDSRMTSSNMSNSSDKSQLHEELRNEIAKCKQEMEAQLKQIKKYKVKYLLLEKKCKEDTEKLHDQFRDKLQRLNAEYSSKYRSRYKS